MSAPDQTFTVGEFSWLVGERWDGRITVGSRKHNVGGASHFSVVSPIDCQNEDFVRHLKASHIQHWQNVATAQPQPQE